MKMLKTKYSLTCYSPVYSTALGWCRGSAGRPAAKQVAWLEQALGFVPSSRLPKLVFKLIKKQRRREGKRE